MNRLLKSPELIRLISSTKIHHSKCTTTFNRYNHDEAVSITASPEQQLPLELSSKNLIRLTCPSSADSGTCDVHVIGTCHVSDKSRREVEQLISYLKPEVVFLELCERRKNVLTLDKAKVPTMGEMMVMFMKKNQHPLGVVYGWFLSKVATELGVFPGSEFRAAYVEANKYGGKVVLGDRAVQITLQRTWRRMPLAHKLKLLKYFFHSSFSLSPGDLKRAIKQMDAFDMLTLAIQEMSKEFPTLIETIVHERDQYMSHKLLKVASKQSSVVAVVGKGHLEGIKRHWKQPVDVEKLLEVPSKKPTISAANIVTLAIT